MKNWKWKWKCDSCGYIHDGDELPVKCPKCGAPKEKFVLLNEVDEMKCEPKGACTIAAAPAKLIERSRHTNTLHARVVDLARQVEASCNDGIKDDLDPGCVDVFTKSREMAWQMMKLSMTEMQAHVQKGKWG